MSAPAERWWHGGPHVCGQWILPPIESGKCRTSDGLPDRVYITPLKSLALTYAATCDGWVYEVEPEGEILPDPDSIIYTSRSSMCSRARIIRRIKPSRADVARYAAVVRIAEKMMTPTT
jgi:hypothetical protein